MEEGAVNMDNLRREDWIIGGLALLLVIDLLALPWFTFGGGSVSGISLPSIDFTATDTPDGFLGILAVLAALAINADLAIERFSPDTQLPAIGGSRQTTRLVLAVAAAVFMGLKFLFHLSHFSNLGWGFWIGAVLVGALVFFAMQAHQAARAAPSAPAAPAGRSGRAATSGPPASSGPSAPSSAPAPGSPPASSAPPAQPGPQSNPSGPPEP
jgi:hypothetical protein